MPVSGRGWRNALNAPGHLRRMGRGLAAHQPLRPPACCFKPFTPPFNRAHRARFSSRTILSSTSRSGLGVSSTLPAKKMAAVAMIWEGQEGGGAGKSVRLG